MCRILLLTACLLFKLSWGQEIDRNICPNGLTVSPSDPQWPIVMPNHFEVFAEVTTDGEAIEMTQLFAGPDYDTVIFHNFELQTQTYYDFQTNEMLIINNDMQCDRSEIGQSEGLTTVVSQILKPSILLGFDGRNRPNNEFHTRFTGGAIIRDGITTERFESCFYVAEQQLTINATYYLTAPFPNETHIGIEPEFVQIDVRSNNFPYTYNIIRFIREPNLVITTPSGVFCPNRTVTKDIPENVPSSLSFHAEALLPIANTENLIIESYHRLIDEPLLFERIDYGGSNDSSPSGPTRLLIDYSAGLSYLYMRETQQCTVMNISSNTHMQTMSEIIFQFGADTNSVNYQYTGIHSCGREHLQCHRWIGQQNSSTFIQQYEWYWTAKYNDIDLQQLIPIKVFIDIIQTNSKIHQEFSLFNYNPSPDSMQAIDTTMAECYRALGPSHGYNYAILRMTLNNDAKHPVERHLLSLQHSLHRQLVTDLRIRHIRLSSFVIDTTRESTEKQDTDVYVTFTLLDNPPVAASRLKELSSLELIKQLAVQINRGEFQVRDEDGGYELRARPNTLRTLVLYLSPSENQTNIYPNDTQTIVHRRTVIVEKHTGGYIAALATGFALLGLVVAIAIGSFWAVRKWAPTIQQRS